MKRTIPFLSIMICIGLLSGCTAIFKSKPKLYYENRSVSGDLETSFNAVIKALEKNEYYIRNQSIERLVIDGMKHTEPSMDIRSMTEVTDIVYGITILFEAESDSTTLLKVSLQKAAFNRHRHLLAVEHLRDPLQFDPFFRTVIEELEMTPEKSE